MLKATSLYLAITVTCNFSLQVIAQDGQSSLQPSTTAAESPATISFSESERSEASKTIELSRVKADIAAVQYAKRELTDIETRDDASVDDLLVAIRKLAQLHFDQSDYYLAEPLWKRVVSISEEQHGENSLETAAALMLLARSRLYAKWQERVLPLIERALAIREASLGDNHPDTIASLSQMVFFYVDTDLISEPADKLKELHKIYPVLKQRSQKIQPENTVVQAESRLALAWYHLFSGSTKPVEKRESDLQTAEGLLKEASNTEDVRVHAVSTLILANMEASKGDIPSAVKRCERVLDLCEKQLGLLHATTVQSRWLRAQLYRANKVPEQADRLFTNLAEKVEAEFGGRDIRTLSCLNQCAKWSYAVGNWERHQTLNETMVRSLAKDDDVPPWVADIHDELAFRSYKGESYNKRLAERLAHSERAMSIRQHVYGTDSTAVAKTLLQIAKWKQRQEKFDEAERCLVRSMKITQDSLGLAHPRTTGAAVALAKHYRYHTKDLSKSQTLLLSVYDRANADLSSDHESRLLYTLLESIFPEDENEQGDVGLPSTRVEDLLSRYVDAVCKVHGKGMWIDSQDFEFYLGYVKRHYSILKELPEAERVARAAIVRWEATNSLEVGSYCSREFADILRLQDKRTEAWDEYFKVYSKGIVEDETHVTLVLNGIVFVIRDLCEFAAEEADVQIAYRRLKSIVSEAESRKGYDHETTNAVRQTVGRYFSEAGNHAGAIEQRLNHANSLLRSGDVSRASAEAFHQLADSYSAIDDSLSAIPHYKEVLNIAGKLKRDVVYFRDYKAADSLADCLKNASRFDEAEQMYRRSLELARLRFGDEADEFASGLNALALLLDSRGKLQEAESLYRQSMQILVENHGEEHVSVAARLHNIASIYQAKGRNDDAVALFSKAIKIEEKLRKADSKSSATTRRRLASLLASNGEVEEPLRHFHLSEQSEVSHLTESLPFLSASQQKRFADDNRYFGREYSFAIQHRSIESVASRSFEWCLNGKGIVQEATAKQVTLHAADEDSELGTALAMLHTTRSKLASLALNLADTDPIGKEQIEQLNLQEQTLARKLRSVIRQEKHQWLKSQQLADSIPNGAVLVDFLRIDSYNFNANPNETSWGADRYIAWVVKPGGFDIELIDLGIADEIDELTKQVRAQTTGRQVRTIGSLGEETAADQINATLAVLASRILEPLSPHLADSKQLILSPDSQLWLVPWAALPVTSEGESTYLIENYALRLISTGRDLLRPQTKHIAQAAALFCDPLYLADQAEKRPAIERILKKPIDGESDLSIPSGTTRLIPTVPDLPLTASEAAAIEPKIAAYTGRTPTIYAKQYALERVAKSLKSPEVVTFATHGFFLSTAEMEKQREGLSQEQSDRQTATMVKSDPLSNPLLRCGLLLAGSNDPNSILADDDGILTGLEILGIDFRGTKLVVLSACDTGIGDIRNGEGVAGLRQAFQLAGAESVLASLWQVEDMETARLMILFFDNLATGMNKSEALRQAQLTRIRARRERYGAAHPFFWAAFTLTGQD